MRVKYQNLKRFEYDYVKDLLVHLDYPATMDNQEGTDPLEHLELQV